MGRTTALRAAIKTTFVPFAAARGYTVSMKNLPQFLEFRQTRGKEVRIFDIQWEKYGRPRFVVNFCTCPAEGLMIQGKVWLPDDVNAGWGSNRGRLQPGRGATTGNWFRQDRALWERLLGRGADRAAEEVVAELTALFPEVEAFWDTAVTGPHLRLMPASGLATPALKA